jgi:hypothetical protein
VRRDGEADELAIFFQAGARSAGEVRALGCGEPRASEHEAGGRAIGPVIPIRPGER